MIENKVLVTINVPYLEDRYDVYIPVNRKVYSVIRMLAKTLHTISHGSFDEKKQYVLIFLIIISGILFPKPSSVAT